MILGMNGCDRRFGNMPVTGLRTYPVPEAFLDRPGRTLLALIWRIERDFWTGGVNGGSLFFCLGWAGLRWLRQGDMTAWWLPLQLILIPALMAVEEFLHTVVMIRKGISPEIVDLVMIQKVGRNGIVWLCCGAAARVRGKVSGRDRIHIAAPGPLLSLVLLGLAWLICGLLDGHPWWGSVHRMTLPVLSYLAGGWFPLPAVLTPDVVVIRQAAQEEGYSLRRMVKESYRGIRCLWRKAEGRG